MARVTMTTEMFVLTVLVLLLDTCCCLVLPERKICPSECMCDHLPHEGYNINCSHISAAGIVTGSKLEKILEGIPKGAHRIYLEFDQIRELPVNAFSHIPQLRQLRMSNNVITNISDIVQHLHPRTQRGLNHLNLDHNNISRLSTRVFSELHRLENLHMNHNNVMDIDDGAFSGMKTLITLELRHNSLAKLGRGSLNGLKSLQHLTLDYNKLNSIDDGTFNDLLSLRELTLSHNSLRTVGMSAGVLSGLSSLRTINLASNGMKEMVPQFFNSTPELGTVFLDRNELKEIPLRALVGLRHLTALYLTHNQITMVTDGFGLLTNLNLAYLNFNNISEIEPNSLLPIHHLKNLWLNDNKLRTLPESLRQRFLHMQYGYLLLRNNPFYCDCRLVWLVHWIQNQVNVSSEMYSGDLPICAGPGDLAGRQMDDVILSDMICDYSPVKCNPSVTSSQCSYLRWRTCKKSATVNSCLCREGNNTCFVCPTGSYGNHQQNGGQKCRSCPPFSTTTLPGARTGDECLCQPGYSRDSDGRCQPCRVGYFKHTSGPGACGPCAPGSGSLYTGTVTCDCSPGYTVDHETGVCGFCPVNTYKHYHGNLPCRPCPQRSFSKQGSNSIHNCTCQEGNIRADVNGGVKCRRFVQGDWRTIGRPSVTYSDPVTSTNNISHVARHDGTTQAERGIDGRLFVILLPVCVILLVTITMVTVVCLCRRTQRQTPLKCGGQNTVRNPLYDDMELPMLNPPYSRGVAPSGDNRRNKPEWLLYRENLNLGDVIGQGAFGQVVVATMTSEDDLAERKVAVKSVRPDSGYEEREALMSELERMMDVGKHQNVVQLLGAFWLDGDLLIVMEYAEGGNLSQYLKKRHRAIHHESESESCYCVMSEPELISTAWQICKGMAHLASLKCVHRDLACRNILLTDKMVAKVSDFGLAREVYENGCYFKETKGRVPFKWMSPEALLSGRYTTKSDVWSFGILLWEICTLGSTPYPGIPTDQICDLLKSGYKMSRPDYCDEQLYAIMLRCWSDVPRDRPSFSHLVEWFDGLVALSANQSYLALEPEMANCVPLAPSVVGKSTAPPTASSGTNGADAEDCCYGYERPVTNSALRSKEKVGVQLVHSEQAS